MVLFNELYVRNYTDTYKAIQGVIHHLKIVDISNFKTVIVNKILFIKISYVSMLLRILLSIQARTYIRTYVHTHIKGYHAGTYQLIFLTRWP